MNELLRRIPIILCLLFLLLNILTIPSFAQPIEIPQIRLEVGGDEEGDDLVLSLQILILLTVLSLAPAIIIMTTSFTRIVIVLALIRNALGTQRMPPTQLLIGLALFLTFYIMAPVFQDINEQALQPYLNQEINQEQALNRAFEPLKQFMLRQTRKKDLALFAELRGETGLEDKEAVPAYILIPAFIISELKTAFQIGFLIYLPFLVIDMVVASILMSMGMLMLPPVMISLPFKLLLFVLVDGWYLVIESLIRTF